MLSPFVYALLLATANCTGTASSWPFTLVDVTTTRHLAEVDLRQGESGPHGYLVVNTKSGYRCIGTTPGGVPNASVYARLASSLQAMGVPASAGEVSALITGNGAAGIERFNFSFFYRHTAKSLFEIAPMSSTRATAIRRALLTPPALERR